MTNLFELLQTIELRQSMTETYYNVYVVDTAFMCPECGKVEDHTTILENDNIILGLESGELIDMTEQEIENYVKGRIAARQSLKTIDENSDYSYIEDTKMQYFYLFTKTSIAERRCLGCVLDNHFGVHRNTRDEDCLELDNKLENVIRTAVNKAIGVARANMKIRKPKVRYYYNTSCNEFAYIRSNVLGQTDNVIRINLACAEDMHTYQEAAGEYAFAVLHECTHLAQLKSGVNIYISEMEDREQGISYEEMRHEKVANAVAEVLFPKVKLTIKSLK